MTMTVVPNADGSYTIECNGVKMTVGGPPTARRKPPKTPDPNDGGVVAYLHVGTASAIQIRPLGNPSIDLLPSPFAHAVPGADVTLYQGFDGPTVVELQVPPGTPLDMDRLQAAVAQWRDDTGRDAELHIHVGWGEIDPPHIETGLVRG